MVLTTEFNQLFDELVASRVGGVLVGRRVFIYLGDLTAGLLRVELRHQPPVRLLLGVRRNELRTIDDSTDPRRPSNPSDYPIKIAPSRAEDLLTSTWRYTPQNLGYWPDTDVIDYPEMRLPECSNALDRIGSVLAVTLPRLGETFSAEHLATQIELHGENAWVEQRWLQDLRSRHHR